MRYSKAHPSSVIVADICAEGRVRDRGTVIQKKTGQLVQFEITDQFRLPTRAE